MTVNPDTMSGITEGRIVVRFASGTEVLPGSFVWLDVTGAASYSVEGKLVTNSVTKAVSVMKRKVAFKTLGCRLNQFETDSVLTDFYKTGYEIVGFQ